MTLWSSRKIAVTHRAGKLVASLAIEKCNGSEKRDLRGHTEQAKGPRVKVGPTTATAARRTANAPGNGALFACSRCLVSLTFDACRTSERKHRNEQGNTKATAGARTQVHDVVAANGAVIYDKICKDRNKDGQSECVASATQENSRAGKSKRNSPAQARL